MQNLDTETSTQSQLVTDLDHELMLEHVIAGDHELLYMDAYLSEYFKKADFN